MMCRKPHDGFSRAIVSSSLTLSARVARGAAGTTAVVLRGDLLAVPPKDGLRRCERRHLGQPLSAERLSLLGEQPSLGVGEPKTFVPEPVAQHTVLRAQVLDCLALAPPKPAGD